MKKCLPIVLLLLFCLQTIGFAQNNYTISGSITDIKKSPLPGAAIYVSGYQIATVSNADGKFILPKLAPGNYDILVKMIGFETYSKTVEVTNQSVNFNVILKESITTLNEVVVKPDPNRAYYIALFKDFFIGRTPNSKECSILNTDILRVDDDKQQSLITIKADEFLIIENKALGYKIKYLLDYFEYNYKTRVIFYAGRPFFEPLKGGNTKQKRWQKNRILAYNGSIQHFFKSLYANKLEEEGFVINKIINIPNPTRLPDSIINANVKRLTAGQNGALRILTYNGSDSLNYWIKQRNQPKQVSVLNRANVPLDTLVKPFNTELKMMNYTDGLYVIYKNEKEDETFANSGHQQNKPADLLNYQVSIIELLEPPVRFYQSGGVLDPRSVLYKGFWAYEKMADLMPMDYILNKQNVK